MDNQNAWNNFQKEQKAKLKGSEVADVHQLKDTWKAMPKEEREKYGLKHEGPKITIHCSASNFVNKLKGLGKKRCEALKNNLKDNPFKSLLEMDGSVSSRKLILSLVSNFDTTSKSLHINGCDYIVTPKDFTSIMGIEDGDEDIDLESDPSEELKELFADRKAKQFHVCNEKVLKHLKDDDINIANKAYALFSLIHIVSPPGRSSLKGKYLNNIDDMKNKKWATHALDTLVKGIASFKKGKGTVQSRLGGCVLFLQLFYMSKAGMTPPPKDVKLLKYVKKNTVDNFLKKHGMLFKEREDTEASEESSERVVEHGEKKPKKQKVIEEEEVIANSLSSTFKELEKQMKICEEEYPQNNTCKDIKKKMQRWCDETEKKASKEHITKAAEALLLLKKPETQNEDTILVGPFHVRTTIAPTAEDKKSAPTTDPISPETSQIDAMVNQGIENKAIENKHPLMPKIECNDDVKLQHHHYVMIDHLYEMRVSSQKADAGSSLNVYTRKKQKVRGQKERHPGFTFTDAMRNQDVPTEGAKCDTYSPNTTCISSATGVSFTEPDSVQFVPGSNLAPPVMLQFAKTRKLSVERSDPRNRALLQKRHFFHSHRAQPMAVEQVFVEQDSEDEVDDDVADLEDRRMLDDYVDVPKDEKHMMHIWNSFIRKQRVLADSHMPWACEAFSISHKQDFVQNPALLWCWRLFMIKLWNHGLIDQRTLDNCNLIIEQHQHIINPEPY